MKQARLRPWFIFLAGFIFFSLLSTSSAAAQETDDKTQKEKPVAAAARQRMTTVRLGAYPEFSRLLFIFEQPVSAYKIDRVDVDNLLLDFGPAYSEHKGRLPLGGELVEGVAVGWEGKNLTARVKIREPRFNFRHFTSADKKTVAVDIRSAVPIGPAGPGSKKGVLLKIPSAEKVALSVRSQLSNNPQANSDLELLVNASEFILNNDFPSALTALQTLEGKFPKSPYLDPGLFLLGDVYYNISPENPAEHFLATVGAYQKAIGAFPESKQVPRALIMLGESYKRMEFVSESAGYLKTVAKNYPGNPYAAMARIFLGLIYLDIKKLDLARASFQEALKINPQGPLFLDAYYELGKGHYDQGLYSGANEIFKAILNQNEDFYLTKPHILFYIGDGYFHLGRRELSRDFLLHSINLQPSQDDADIILARLGDSYQEEKNYKTAAEVYSQVRDLYPDGVGALIAQLRMADMGALRGLYNRDAIFIELEEGANEAMIKIYGDLVDSEKKSPLLQLALFKLGRAQIRKGDNTEAAYILESILNKYPQSKLAPEIEGLLNGAILEQIRDHYNSRSFKALSDFYISYKRRLNKESWPEVRHYLGLANAAQGMTSTAIELLKANKGMTEKEDERLYTLGMAYLDVGQYEDAGETLDEFRKKFPKDKLVSKTLLDQARSEYSRNLDEDALKHLEEAAASDVEIRKDLKIQDMFSRLYLKKGDYEKAIPALNDTLNHLKEHPETSADTFWIYTQLGESHIKLEQPEKAVEAFELALANSGENARPEALYLIANHFKTLDREDRYLETLERLTKSEDSFWKQAAETELKTRTPDENIEKLLKEGPSL